MYIVDPDSDKPMQTQLRELLAANATRCIDMSGDGRL